MQYDRITVEMIEQKEFKSKVRGYDPDEVDAFLDSICDEIIALQDEIDALNLKLSQQKATGPATAKPPVPVVAPVVTPVVAKPVVSDNDVDSFKEILETAKKVSDQTIKEAQDRANAIIAKAQEESDKRIGNLESEHEQLTDQIEMLKLAAKDYRDRFNQLVEDQKHILASQKELFK